MRKILTIIVTAGLLPAFAGCGKKQSTVDSPVERGKYLVTIGGCHDCHTPKVEGPGGLPVPDTTRLFAGHPEGLPYPTWTPADLQQRNAMALTNPMGTAWAGPWGVSFASNLTPDISTGLGEWTEQTFIQTMRTGKHQGQPNGRDILPPMPWFNLKEMPENDLKALWAYLRSIPPIKNQVPIPAVASSSPTAGK
jgi:hypothetical protein